MKISFVTECDYNLSHSELVGSDLVLFPFYTEKAISYNKEIKGITSFFRSLTNLSKYLKTTVIAGVDTDSYGSVRHSAAVCDNGKLLGISDMNYVWNEEKYIGGGGFRLFETKAGRIGVAVGNDVICNECVKALSQCGADIIVNISDGLLGGSIGVIARSRAFEFGLPVAVCASKASLLALPNGQMAFCSPAKVTSVEVRTDKNYNIVSMRRRGHKVP